ncbi:MAG: rhodanese-like domain-containing protein [Chloroflexota bacterium]|nr:rhodanese-like domain-containing protein [Chloroflexota bacterium]
MTAFSTPDPVAVPEIDHRAAAEAYQTGSARFVDVREPEEWAAGHIPGALHIPLAELAARAAEIPRGEPIILVCRVGGRSHLATEYLRGLGYDRAVNFDGGMLAWEEAGHPVE